MEARIDAQRPLVRSVSLVKPYCIKEKFYDGFMHLAFYKDDGEGNLEVGRRSVMVSGREIRGLTVEEATAALIGLLEPERILETGRHHLIFSSSLMRSDEPTARPHQIKLIGSGLPLGVRLRANHISEERVWPAHEELASLTACLEELVLERATGQAQELPVLRIL